jgi:hypothetical protein
MHKDNISLRLQNARYLNFKHAAPCSHMQPLEWPQVAARNTSKRVAASGRKWPLSATSISTLKATPLKDSAQQISLNNFGGQEIVKI